MKAKRIISAAAAALTALSLAACSMPPSREERAARTTAEVTEGTTAHESETTADTTSTEAPVTFTIADLVALEMKKRGVAPGMNEEQVKSIDKAISNNYGDGPMNGSEFGIYSDFSAKYNGYTADYYLYRFKNNKLTELSYYITVSENDEPKAIYDGLKKYFTNKVGHPYTENGTNTMLSSTYYSSLWGNTDKVSIYLFEQISKFGTGYITLNFTDNTAPAFNGDMSEYTSPEIEYDRYCEISFGSAQLKWDDYDNKDYVVEEIKFRNFTGKDVSISPEYSWKAFQNGVECSPNYGADVERNDYLTIREGASLNVYFAFYPRNYTDDIEIVVYGDYGNTEIAHDYIGFTN